MEHSQKPLFAPDDLARMLGYASAEPVYRLIRNGSLQARDISLTPGRGRPRYAVTDEDWRAFLDSRKVPPPPKPIPKRRARRFADVPQVYL